MRRVFGCGVTAVLMMAFALAAVAQSTAQNTGEKGTGNADRGEGRPVAAATTPDMRTEKQKALAAQAERLCDMAAELKVQVDKTNKNILSLTVVEKAEAIEALAKGMRVQAKK